MIEVAVIGAGSAGLVTARHLLASGLKCCIFEAAATLGGAWNGGVSDNSEANLPPLLSKQISSSSSPMWKGLRTNLSKHTCQFSDFPWPDNTPTFPSKDDMDWYFEAYSKEFLLDGEEATKANSNGNDDGNSDSLCSFLYDCKVTKISPIGCSDTNVHDDNLLLGQDGYRIEWTDSVAQTKHSKEFVGVVLATGFFSKPNYPSGILSELEKRKKQHSSQEQEPFPMQIFHSKEYSTHENFGPTEDEETPQKVVVVGSSHSALEIAVDLTKSTTDPVTVVMSRVPWVVPRYVPASNDKNSGDGFLPIDLAFYRRKNEFGMAKETTALTSKSCRSKNEYLRALLGPRQDKILPVSQSCFDQPPMVAISDLFLDLVANGRIDVVEGRLEGLTDDGTGLKISMAKGNDETNSIIEGIPGVTSLICCTGYSPDLESCFGCDQERDENGDSTHEKDVLSPSLNSILKTVKYDPKDAFSPMTTHLETIHPQLSNLAFVGMYRGQYMGVAELQARLAAQYLCGTCNLSEEEFKIGLETSDAIRNQIPTLRPQFPRFDYLGFVDSLTESLSGPKQFPQQNVGIGDMVAPAFYQPDTTLAARAKADLEKEIEKGKSGHYLPGVVTSALVGNWSFERDIIHFANGGKSIAQRQYIHGKVNYSRSKDHKTVRYREDGFFEISPTKSLPVFREYDYLCTNDDGSGAMELYFVENGEMAHLFLSLQFQNQDKDGYWVATNDHLCIKDLYKGNFRVKLDGLAATEVIITYRVRGPSKDYESTTTMRPI